MMRNLSREANAAATRWNRAANPAPIREVTLMPKVQASDLGEIGQRAGGRGDPDALFDGIPWHADRGCFVHPSCIDCPLPECRLVDPAGYRRFLREDVNRRLVAAVLHEGFTVLDAAKRFRRSERAVYKILAKHRACPECGGLNNRLVRARTASGSANRMFHCRHCQHMWSAQE